MIAICNLESDGIATASNWHDSHDGCNGSFGILQVACVHGVAREDLYDPATNIKIGYSLFTTVDKGGNMLKYSPWSTYKKLLAMYE